MKLRFGSLVLGLLLCGCDDDESKLRPIPLPECSGVGYSVCDTRSAACQEQLLSLAACAYGQASPPTVPIRVLDEDQFRQEIEAGLEEPDPAELAENEYVESVLHDLGLVEVGALSAQGSIDTLVETFAGVYQNAKDGIVIIDRGQSQASIEADSTLIHEFVHALQDADYELESWIEPHKITTDELLAAKAVIEGEATFYQFRIVAAMLGHDVQQVDFEATFQNLRDDLIERAETDASPAIMSFATFPYAYGSTLSYREWLRGEQGFEAALFETPPLTTLDVMLRADPAGESTFEPPAALAAPAEPGDYELVLDDSLGAWNLRLFLKVHGFDDESVTGLPVAWANDHLWLYQNADARGWLWELELGNAAAAAAIAQGLSLAGQLPSGLELTQQGRGLFIVGEDAPQFLLDAGQAFLDGL